MLFYIEKPELPVAQCILDYIHWENEILTTLQKKKKPATPMIELHTPQSSDTRWLLRHLGVSRAHQHPHPMMVQYPNHSPVKHRRKELQLMIRCHVRRWRDGMKNERRVHNAIALMSLLLLLLSFFFHILLLLQTNKNFSHHLYTVC